MVDEPVRGRTPDPSFYSLPGLDRLRAYQRGLVALPPLWHLTGFSLTQLDTGTATFSLPLSPWLQLGDGTVDIAVLTELALNTAILTTAPAGSEVLTSALSLQHLRPCTLKSETLIARSRVLNSGPKFTVAEVLLEDRLGRAIALAVGSGLVHFLDPAPPPLPGPLQPSQEPAYATADPYLRPLPPDTVIPQDAIEGTGGWPEITAMWAAGKLPAPPACQLFGLRCIDASEGSASWVVRTSQWLCIFRQVEAGVISTLAHYALKTAVGTLCPADRRVVVLDEKMSFLGPVMPDGRDVLARATVTHQWDLLVAVVEVTDGDGNAVAVGSQTALLSERAHKGRRGEPERILATVLFTDIVGSTQRAEELVPLRRRGLAPSIRPCGRRPHRWWRRSATLRIPPGRKFVLNGEIFRPSVRGRTPAKQGGRP